MSDSATPWGVAYKAPPSMGFSRQECDLGSIPGSGRSPGEGNGNPLQHSCLENPVDSSLEEPDRLYSPWGCKESDTTEQLRSMEMRTGREQIYGHSGGRRGWAKLKE